jgi:hypothetical protein
MKRIKKESWRDVTIDEYFELVDRLDDADRSGCEEYEKEVIKVSFSSGMDEDELWNLPINEFRKLQSESLWMDSFEIDERVKFRKMNISGETYSIDTNLQNFTVAQYIDFQTFYRKFKSDKRVIGNILACFVIPEGKRYADGYDIKEIVDRINGNIDIMTAQEIMFFFLKSYLISIRATANYFNVMMRRMKRRSKDKARMERMEKDWEATKRSILDGLRSSTTSASSQGTSGTTSSPNPYTSSSTFFRILDTRTTGQRNR